MYCTMNKAWKEWTTRELLKSIKKTLKKPSRTAAPSDGPKAEYHRQTNSTTS